MKVKNKSNVSNFTFNSDIKSVSKQINPVAPSIPVNNKLDIKEKNNYINGFFTLEIDQGLNSEIRINNNIPSLEELPDFTKTPFRIGILVDKNVATFGAFDGNLYSNENNEKKLIMSLSNSAFKVTSKNGSYNIYDENSNLIGNFRGRLTIEDNKRPIIIDNKKYRGNLEISLNPKNTQNIHVINNVMLEDYLKGVVPAESPASWPLESLKAQAIAARTYSISNWNKNKDLGFDLKPTVSDQVYKGVSIEHDSTNKAVDETNGKIALYNGKPINALFHSTAGGYTDSSKGVWGVDLPYIKPVKSFDEASSKSNWNKTFSNDQIKNALKKLNLNIGAIQSIESISFTSVGRVKEIEFIGTNGEEIVDANKFRFALGMDSTWWKVEASEKTKFSWTDLSKVPKDFSFSGKGWGHGLGMSQWGARQMAKDGKSGEDIIRHFYSNVEIGYLDK